MGGGSAGGERQGGGVFPARGGGCSSGVVGVALQRGVLFQQRGTTIVQKNEIKNGTGRFSPNSPVYLVRRSDHRFNRPNSGLNIFQPK